MLLPNKVVWGPRDTRRLRQVLAQQLLPSALPPRAQGLESHLHPMHSGHLHSMAHQHLEDSVAPDLALVQLLLLSTPAARLAFKVKRLVLNPGFQNQLEIKEKEI